jgi:hypothetical protein
MSLSMQLYKSKSRKISGVIKYEAGKDFILVQFTNRKKYLYTYSSAGKTSVELMKKLATANKGLSTYISQHQPAYQNKL